MKPNHKFLNDLYIIDHIKEDGNKIMVKIVLNPSHDIFKGHFPGNPILPGVCIVQILKELLMNYSGKKLILKKASSIKYLSFINPEVNSTINIDVEMREMGDINFFCNASFYFESVVFCRFSGEFIF